MLGVSSFIFHSCIFLDLLICEQPGCSHPSLSCMIDSTQALIEFMSLQGRMLAGEKEAS